MRETLAILFDFDDTLGPDSTSGLLQSLGADVLERRELMLGLTRATVATDQFRTSLSGVGGAMQEAMACGTPVMTHTNGASRDPDSWFYECPVLDVLEEEEIFGVLCDIDAHPARYRELGSRCREWFDVHLGRGLAARYVQLLILLAEDPSLTQRSDLVPAQFERLRQRPINMARSP